MKTTEISYEIKDTNYGTKVFLHLPEGDFTLNLRYHRGMNNRRVWTVDGTYPEDKYLISYENGKLFVLPKGGDYKVGQIIEHKAHGKGTVISVNETSVVIDFGTKGEKMMLKSILKNFIK